MDVVVWDLIPVLVVWGLGRIKRKLEIKGGLGRVLLFCFRLPMGKCPSKYVYTQGFQRRIAMAQHVQAALLILGHYCTHNLWHMKECHVS